MEWADLIGFAGSAATGGVLGLAGTVITALFDWGKRKAEIGREIELRKLDLEELGMEHTLAIRQTQAQLDLEEIKGANALAVTEEQAAADMAVESYRHDQATYSKGRAGVAGFFLVLVDVIRGLMRPGITAIGLWLLYEIMQLLQQLTGGQLSTTQAADLWLQVVNAVILLAMTASTWWFGLRGMRPAKPG